MNWLRNGQLPLFRAAPPSPQAAPCSARPGSSSLGPKASRQLGLACLLARKGGSCRSPASRGLPCQAGGQDELQAEKGNRRRHRVGRCCFYRNQHVASLCIQRELIGECQKAVDYKLESFSPTPARSSSFKKGLSTLRRLLAPSPPFPSPVLLCCISALPFPTPRRGRTAGLGRVQPPRGPVAGAGFC